MRIKPVFDIIGGNLLDMAEVFAYDGIAVRVPAIGHAAQMMLHITVRTVEAHLLELLDNNMTLHFKSLLREGQPHHAVAFEPKRRLEIHGRKHIIEVCIVA